MSVHTEQVASVLARAVQDVLVRGLHDPRVRGLISVTGVKVSDDLANATVMLSIMPAEHADLAMHGIRHAGGYIRREVGNRVRMRRVPRLSFKLDHSLKRQSEVLAAIDAAMRREAKAAPEIRHPPSTEESSP
jgi:ribosome-binding factor A